MRSGLLLLGLLAAGLAQAVTLGQIRVISYLNQPLEAEIELIGVEPGQHEDLRIRVANQDQFDRLGIPYTRFLADLRFDVIQTSGRWVVRVRSRQPVNEPFLDFPVQMTWPEGQIVRQYTLLLDPLTLSRPATVRRAPSPAAAPPRTAPEPATAPVAGYGGSTYGPIRRGETLWPIAQRLKPSGITTQQMAMALLRANPQAFIDNNINRLRAGSVLTVPPLGEIERLDAATAQRQFSEQTRQWRAPVATSPREVTTSSPPAAAPPTQADSAAQAEAAERPAEELQTAEAPAPESNDQLRIVTEDEAEPAASDEESIKRQLLVTMEEIESNRIATGEIESRLAQLEQELKNLQALVDLKDQQIAALQSEIAERDEMARAADAAGPTPPDAQPRAAPTPSAESAAATPPAPEPVVEITPEPEAPVTVETEAVPSAEPPRAPWFDQYQWLLYGLLGVMAVLLVLWVIRRQFAETTGSNVPMSDLPSAAPTPVYPGARQPAREELSQAERDFQGLAAVSVQEIEPEPRTAEPLPNVAPSEAEAADREMEELTNSLLDEILEEGKELDERPEARPPNEVSEDDIASWVEELGSELDELEVSGNQTDEKTPVKPAPSADKAPEDDEIPSLLTALDDQLSTTDSTVSGSSSNIELEPLDERSADATGAKSAGDYQPDDTFTMSLDLARAYLEIGDNDGASDMLKQALSSTQDPEHRRQIEELLRQIG